MGARMSGMYKGNLNQADRNTVDRWLDTGISVREVAKQTTLPYGQVRGYVEWKNKQEPQARDGAFKVLFFDIESAPMLSHIWSPYTEYVRDHMIVKEKFMLGWAAKWWGSDQIIADFLSSEEAVAQDESRVIVSLAKLIQEADIVVAHNADKFDVPEVNGSLLMGGHEMMGPVDTIDTLKLAKASFRLPYYNLDYLAKSLGLGEKTTTAFELWRECYAGDPAALEEMQDYCANDVVLLENVFEAMIPYVKRLRRLFDNVGNECPYCGEDQWQSRGYKVTQASKFQQFQCMNCGRYSRKRVSNKIKGAYVPV